ncbi:RsmB/NOP family class I SAM-dependent RNA methyltransferase [Paenibacillus thermoaerophilus]|uniref:RsmB/NOP family class I SAM-dependent RNA methyltransferase n=1 Tax=Paenibacillus thermoaerophilus TaxID=1215385 RepID=A0ABW2V7I5_9BACL|nr:RsmB/NOP family class I SAM-dependent RNA methyltransferase [Paenibacillus thermoaerophilus]TMV17824.1 rRNA cytosine-C5-methyltransferase [Paenibacillus thermoaerophilus]
MTIKLPEHFRERMKELLASEYDEFEASYGRPAQAGLRLNPLKTGKPGQADKIAPAWREQPVPWCPTGYYLPEGARPGKHPHYHAGIYFIQEPSAMAPVELLDVKPGDRVLDLCAAPGGKSTQIAGKLAGSGLLVSNDNHPDRAKALLKNIELAGVRNAVVLNETPERLSGRFAGFFDKILVDAPCSGEGMFRKDPDMLRAYDAYGVDRCSAMQRSILAEAVKMLKPGGTLVYSTCTFSAEENEGVIAELLKDRPELETVEAPLRHLFAPGRPEWLGEGGAGSLADSLRRTVRLWPHRIRGEGHYAAVIRKHPDAADSEPSRAPREDRSLPAPTRSEWSAAEETLRECVNAPIEKDRRWATFGGLLTLVPEGLPSLEGLRVVRPGWAVGSFKKGRFAPSHALALGIAAEDAIRSVDFGADHPYTIRYLKGETLETGADELKLSPGAGPKGFVLVTADGFPLGWAKWQDGYLKNEYPPAWRWTP